VDCAVADADIAAAAAAGDRLPMTTASSRKSDSIS